jgi:TRAP-type mannitol/chloroaromatic compound transport system permease large subunit
VLGAILFGLATPHEAAGIGALGAIRGLELTQIFAGVMPFVMIVFVSMFLFYTFPSIGMWLPSVLYR